MPQRRWMTPLLAAAQRGYVHLLWSPSIIAETGRLLTWQWLQRNPSPFTRSLWDRMSRDAHSWFDLMTQVFSVVEDSPLHPAMWTLNPPDAHDAPLWTAAVRADAQVVVTDNLRDGPPPDPAHEGLRLYQGRLYLSAEVFLMILNRWRDLSLGEALGQQASASERGEPITRLPPALELWLQDVRARGRQNPA